TLPSNSLAIRSLTGFGCEPIKLADNEFARTLDIFRCRSSRVRGCLELREHAEVTRDCVEHRLLVVHLYAVGFFVTRGGDDFGDRRYLFRRQSARRIDPDLVV